MLEFSMWKYLFIEDSSMGLTVEITLMADIPCISHIRVISM